MVNDSYLMGGNGAAYSRCFRIGIGRANLGRVLAFRDDRRWFMLNTFEAQMAFSDHPPLNLEGCKSDENLGFSSQRKADTCTILPSNEIGKAVERRLESQRKASVYLLLVFSVFLMFPMAFSPESHEARGLDRKIKDVASPKSEDPASGPADEVVQPGQSATEKGIWSG